MCLYADDYKIKKSLLGLNENPLTFFLTKLNTKQNRRINNSFSRNFL